MGKYLLNPYKAWLIDAIVTENGHKKCIIKCIVIIL